MNSDLRPAFVNLRQQGKKIGDIAKLFNVHRTTVSEAVKRFEATGSNKNRSGQGRPRTARTEENVAAAAIAITAEPSTKVNSTP
jgi:transposase